MGGVTIPKGDLVTAVLGSANHDEAQFPDPETLDLTRYPNRHLARMEGRIALMCVPCAPATPSCAAAVQGQPRLPRASGPREN